MSAPPPAESPSGYATRSSSKRTSLSPQSMENAKRLALALALALAQNPAPVIPSITQTDEDMDWEKVTNDPAKQPPCPGAELSSCSVPEPSRRGNRLQRG
jgi:hypothetical protein